MKPYPQQVRQFAFLLKKKATVSSLPCLNLSDKLLGLEGRGREERDGSWCLFLDIYLPWWVSRACDTGSYDVSTHRSCLGAVGTRHGLVDLETTKVEEKPGRTVESWTLDAGPTSISSTALICLEMNW